MYISLQAFRGRINQFVVLLQTLLDEGLPHPFGIAVHGDHIFWTDRKLNAIQMANKLTGEGVTVLRDNLEDLMDIHMFHRKRHTSRIKNFLLS